MVEHLEFSVCPFCNLKNDGAKSYICQDEDKLPAWSFSHPALEVSRLEKRLLHGHFHVKPKPLRRTIGYTEGSQAALHSIRE